MQLQTQIPLKKERGQIDYNSQLVLLGSCFAANMGEKLSYHKFRSVCNPFGILFHPLAIERVVERAIRKEEYGIEDTFFLNERWQCYDAHSELSALSQKILIERLNQGLQTIREEITKATHLCITLGTAWVYRNKETKLFVANCHKVPQKYFTKELLSVEVISKSMERMLEGIKSINPQVQCLFTISPVRHLKDGFVENQRSKAHLITAVHQLMDLRFKEGNVAYFPSYEIMMDELRDYRFYTTDMIHPNKMAIDYIWDKFKKIWISETVFPIMDKVQSIQKGLEHRPFNPDSGQHQHFLKTIQAKVEKLQEEYPFMKF